MGGMVQYIFTIRKQHSVNKVHTLRYSVSKISEYKSRCFFIILLYTVPQIMVFGAVIPGDCLPSVQVAIYYKYLH